jgi:stage II sporulation protein R
MKKTAIIAGILSLAIIFTVEFFPFKERKVYTDLIRLHILANSDSEEDISLKYKVRDAVLAESEDIFYPCSTTDEAKATMEATGKKIEEIANRVILSSGKTYKAVAVWGKENYPQREYDGLTLPAGEYYSLRILLGEGEGENWWCVLFPPLCLGASKAKTELENVGIEGEAFKTFTDNSPKYKFKFKLLEWIFG